MTALSHTTPESSAGAQSDARQRGVYAAVMLVEAVTILLLWGLDRYFSR